MSNRYTSKDLDKFIKDLLLQHEINYIHEGKSENGYTISNFNEIIKNDETKNLTFPVYFKEDSKYFIKSFDEQINAIKFIKDKRNENIEAYLIDDHLRQYRIDFINNHI